MARSEAESNMKKEGKPLAGKDLCLMREIFETKRNALEDKQAPHEAYVGTILGKIEWGDLRAETLSEVLHMSLRR